VSNAAGAALQFVATPIDTITGANGSAGTPGTDSNLFYSGINNLFTTGSIYGDQDPAASTNYGQPNSIFTSQYVDNYSGPVLQGLRGLRGRRR
jgi:hypothetical protein